MKNDVFASYAVVPLKEKSDFYQKKFAIPTLSVVSENDKGVVISGMKMLQQVHLKMKLDWKLIPLAPDQVNNQ